MCTVTYLPIGNEGFILTSNRDESPMRKTILPKKYLENGVAMMYPKDHLAGGTWIGLSDKNRLVCLLNGGFEKHQRNSYYRMSRGVVVKDILSVEDPVEYISAYDFNNIEPFTIILIDWNVALKAYELVWDGQDKHFKELYQQPKIWSSSTLYNAKVKEDRVAWFEEWLEEHPEYNQNDILKFHESSDKGTQATTLKMKRPFVETVSITSIKKEDKTSMSYQDLRNKESVTLVFQ